MQKNHLKACLAAILICCCWLRTSWFAVAASLDDTNAPNYLIRAWQAESGLPQNNVTSVIQTHDGYLWVGTYSGLARFDGIRFQVFDDQNTPELHNSRVSCLFESRDGILWIGHENGELTIYHDGKFKPVELRTNWANRRIHNITEDGAGDVWLLNDSGLLARVRDGLVLSLAAGTARNVMNLARSTDGAIWVTHDGCLSVLEQGRLHVFKFGQLAVGDTPYVQGTCASGDGALWINLNGDLRKWKAGQWVQDLGVDPWGMSSLTSFTETKNGTLVAATSDNGLYLLFPGTSVLPMHINYINGFQADWITSLVEDRENNLWIGTGGNGLVEMRQSSIQTVAPPDHWQGRALLSVCPGRNGELWAGTEGAGLYCLQNGEWTHFGFTNGFSNSYIWSVAQDTAGKLWATAWGEGLFLRDGDNFKPAASLDQTMRMIRALLVARDDSLWIGTAAGLVHYSDGKTNLFNEANGVALQDVRAIAEDGHGAIWFGTEGHGLGCLENGRIRCFRQTNGLSSDFIECLHFDDDGALWIGTFGGGLCRLKQGHFSVINRAQGLLNGVISHIEDDGNGFFWMGSHGGILRVSKSELNNCADGKIRVMRCLTYGVNDGLPTIECSEGLQPAGCKTPDGRLWFPTSRGLIVVNPDKVRVNRLPPLMAREEFLVDNELMTNALSSLQIPPGRDHFEFHYTGLSFSAPEKVQFKTRLEGLENDWVDAGTKRVAIYNYLPPGHYTFHVMACNNDGIWNETGVSLPFTLLPHFWQTWWFDLLGGLMIAATASGMVWFDTRRRMRRRLEKLEQQQAVERERIRIARDIHDDLGANLTCITMLTQSTRNGIPIPDFISANLERIFNTARELTRSMDEIVWAVNPQHDTLESLASYLTNFAHDFLGAAGIRCRFDLPLQPPPWSLPAEVRHNLFLAFKEALHNTVSHAAASEVQITLKLEENRILLVVEDDGRGFKLNEFFAPFHSKPDRIASGNGLANMKRRLAEINGTCEVQSAPGRGTVVELNVPVSIHHHK